MSEQFSSQPEQPQPDDELCAQLWSNQKRLVAAIQKATSPEAKDALGKELNRNVADLVEFGQVPASEAWALSDGDNPYIDAYNPEDDEGYAL